MPVQVHRASITSRTVPATPSFAKQSLIHHSSILSSLLPHQAPATGPDKCSKHNGQASMAPPRAVDRLGLLHVLASRPLQAKQALSQCPRATTFCRTMAARDARASCPTPPSATPLWILQRRRVSALKAAHRSEAFPERSVPESRFE